MLSSLTAKSAKISVTLQQEWYFLHPPISPSVPAHDPVIRGCVVVELDAPKAVKSIKVVLEGLCDVQSEHGYERSTCLSKELEVDLQGELLAKGTHA